MIKKIKHVKMAKKPRKRINPKHKPMTEEDYQEKIAFTLEIAIEHIKKHRYVRFMDKLLEAHDLFKQLVELEYGEENGKET